MQFKNTTARSRAAISTYPIRQRQDRRREAASRRNNVTWASGWWTALSPPGYLRENPAEHPAAWTCRPERRTAWAVPRWTESLCSECLTWRSPLRLVINRLRDIDVAV